MASLSSITGNEDDLAICQSELKQVDPVRHFTVLTAPEAHRPAFLVLHAFLAELARIPSQVSDISMGQIRLQWWRDIVRNDGIGQEMDNGPATIGPLAASLKAVQRQYHLSTNTLLQIIEARVFDLYHDPMPDLATYETYVGETEALPLMLGAQILNGGEMPAHIADLSGHAAMAIALGQHLYTWPQAAASNRLFLPKNLLAKQGLYPNALFASNPRADVSTGLAPLITLAQSHHFKALALYKSLGTSGQGHLAPAFLRLAPVPLMLKQRRGKPNAPLSLKTWRAYWAVWRMAARS